MFVDLHTHFLPGVDDGPNTLEGTLRLLAAAHAGGTRCLVATPHMFSPLFGNHDPGRIRQCFTDCVDGLRAVAGKPRHAFLAELDLRLGAENFLGPELLEALDVGSRILTLGGGRHLLIELPRFIAADTAVRGAQRILGQGLIPVLAHVERYPELLRHGLDRLLEIGCVAQLNAGSVAGRGGRRLRRQCLELLRTGRAQLVASDCHDADSRPPALGPTEAYLARKLGADRARLCLRDQPMRVLAGHSLAGPQLHPSALRERVPEESTDEP